MTHYPNMTIDQNFPKYGMHRNFSVGGGDLAHDWQGDPRQQPHRYLREERVLRRNKIVSSYFHFVQKLVYMACPQS